MALTQISTGMLASGDGTVDLNIDNGTFVVDVSTSRVGVGNTTPSVKLDITGDMKLSGAADFNGSLDVDGVTNLDVVDIDGAVNMATTLLVTGVLTTTAATVFNGGSTIGTDKKIQFRDAAIHISSSADGQLDLVADTEIQIAATTIDINGNLDVSGTTVSAGKITADAGIDIDNINIDGTTIALSSGDLTLDVAGDIILDADGADIIIKDGGTTFLEIDKDGNNVRLKNPIQDGDILIQGNDGSSVITALTLDMSAAGFATFNNGIVLKNELYINNADASATAGYLYNDSNNFVIRSFTQDKDIIFKGNDGSSVITALTLDMSAAGAATFNNSVTATSLIASNGILELDDNGSHNGIINAPASLFVNIDSDNSNTGEIFAISKDRTSTSGGTVLYSISEAGNAEQKGAGSADFRIIAATDNATITLQAGASDSGAEAAMTYYLQNTTYKWEVGMNTNNSFRWYSYAASAQVLSITGGGDIASQHGSTAGYATTSGNAGLAYVNDTGSGGGGLIISMDADNGWSPLYLNKFEWASGKDNRLIQFNINGSGDTGYINYDGTNFAIGNVSDYRLKENIVSYSGGLAKINAISVKSFNKIAGVSSHITQEGFIAHELREVIPLAVAGEKDAMTTNEEGEEVPDYQTVSKEILIPYLVSAIQEQQSIITALTARITALEA